VRLCSPALLRVPGSAALSQRHGIFSLGRATSVGSFNTLTVVKPAVAAGTQRLTVTNPDGETISLDAAFLANSA
jgi:hypothetical protein